METSSDEDATGFVAALNVMDEAVLGPSVYFYINACHGVLSIRDNELPKIIKTYRDSQGNTLLHLVCLKYSGRKLNRIVQALRNYWFETNSEWFLELSEMKAVFNASNNDNCSPFMCALMHKNASKSIADYSCFLQKTKDSFDILDIDFVLPRYRKEKDGPYESMTILQWMFVHCTDTTQIGVHSLVGLLTERQFAQAFVSHHDNNHMSAVMYVFSDSFKGDRQRIISGMLNGFSNVHVSNMITLWDVMFLLHQQWWRPFDGNFNCKELNWLHTCLLEFGIEEHHETDRVSRRTFFITEMLTRDARTPVEAMKTYVDACIAYFPAAENTWGANLIDCWHKNNTFCPNAGSPSFLVMFATKLCEEVDAKRIKLHPTNELQRRLVYNLIVHYGGPNDSLKPLFAAIESSCGKEGLRAFVNCEYPMRIVETSLNRVYIEDCDDVHNVADLEVMLSPLLRLCQIPHADSFYRVPANRSGMKRIGMNKETENHVYFMFGRAITSLLAAGADMQYVPTLCDYSHIVMENTLSYLCGFCQMRLENPVPSNTVVLIARVIEFLKTLPKGDQSALLNMKGYDLFYCVLNNAIDHPTEYLWALDLILKLDGLDINKTDCYGGTPLIFLCQLKKGPLVRNAICSRERGKQRIRGYPSNGLVGKCINPIIERLINTSGININFAVNLNPIHNRNAIEAAERGLWSTPAYTPKTLTALRLAIFHDNETAVALLLEKGANAGACVVSLLEEGCLISTRWFAKFQLLNATTLIRKEQRVLVKLIDNGKQVDAENRSQIPREEERFKQIIKYLTRIGNSQRRILNMMLVMCKTWEASSQTGANDRTFKIEICGTVIINCFTPLLDRQNRQSKDGRTMLFSFSGRFPGLVQPLRPEHIYHVMRNYNNDNNGHRYDAVQFFFTNTVLLEPSWERPEDDKPPSAFAPGIAPLSIPDHMRQDIRAFDDCIFSRAHKKQLHEYMLTFDTRILPPSLAVHNYDLFYLPELLDLQVQAYRRQLAGRNQSMREAIRVKLLGAQAEEMEQMFNAAVEEETVQYSKIDNVKANCSASFFNSFAKLLYVYAPRAFEQLDDRDRDTIVSELRPIANADADAERQSSDAKRSRTAGTFVDLTLFKRLTF